MKTIVPFSAITFSCSGSGATFILVGTQFDLLRRKEGEGVGAGVGIADFGKPPGKSTSSASSADETEVAEVEVEKIDDGDEGREEVKLLEERELEGNVEYLGVTGGVR